MRDIQELLKIKKYKNAILQTEFESKKNTVVYVTLKNKPRVLKWFVPGLKKQMENEYKILKEGSGKLNIPTPFELDKNNNVIIMDYIIGENLCYILNDEKTTYNEKKRLVTLLSDWFLDFHNFFKKEDQFKIRGDPILRNFIFTDRIWGVDFEESRPGKVVEDIAGMCASILSTDPMFNKEKYQLCRVFIDNYIEKAPGRIISINDEISYSLLQKIQYRPDDEEILRRHSKKIRQNGIKT